MKRDFTDHNDKANARDKKRDRDGWKASRKTERKAKGKRIEFEKGEGRGWK